jgi:redox-sensitive bicupin YhaK (pirin superfamily)
MSAGRGLTHSEFNPDSNEPTHLLQIWIIPNKLSLQPSYQQIKYDPAEKVGRLKLIGSPDGRDGSVVINQDASVYASILDSPSQVYLHGFKASSAAISRICR